MGCLRGLVAAGVITGSLTGCSTSSGLAVRAVPLKKPVEVGALLVEGQSLECGPSTLTTGGETTSSTTCTLLLKVENSGDEAVELSESDQLAVWRSHTTQASALTVFREGEDFPGLASLAGDDRADSIPADSATEIWVVFVGEDDEDLDHVEIDVDPDSAPLAFEPD